jgi:pimeloyl-ACP methyl ester carboxylesterase
MLILTVHGLGGTSFTHIPMKKYLEYYVKANIKNEKLVIDSIDYASRTVSFEAAVNKIVSYLDEYEWANENEYAILIGHSLGGIIVTHIDHHRVGGVITISSPHNSCDFAKYVKDNVPTFLSNVLFGQMYEVLTNSPKKSSIPIIICITSSMLPNLNFDGRVFTREMIHPQASKTLHLNYSGHASQLFSFRMLGLIYIATMDIVNAKVDNTKVIDTQIIDGSDSKIIEYQFKEEDIDDETKIFLNKEFFQY